MVLWHVYVFSTSSIMYGTVISWATMINSGLILYYYVNVQLTHINELAPLNLILFALLLELVIWNLNVKKDHAKFWGTFSAVLYYVEHTLTK